MKSLGASLLFFVGAFVTSVLSAGSCRAQIAPALFTCIGKDMNSNCSNGDTSLRHYSGSTTYKYVTVSGYFEASDGGAGEFYNLGSVTSICASYTTEPEANFSPSSKTITGLSNVSGLAVGELVSSGTLLTKGTEIASIDLHSRTITLTLLPIGTGSNVQVTFAGDNGGTLIIDSEATPQCYQKTNYRGDPHEWGAYGDGNTDDTTALANWLGAPGPWDATIPATYKTTEPLICAPGVNIRAPSNAADGESVKNPIVERL